MFCQNAVTTHFQKPQPSLSESAAAFSRASARASPAALCYARSTASSCMRLALSAAAGGAEDDAAARRDVGTGM